MKNKSFRTLLFSLTVCLSIGSFIFLNHLANPTKVSQAERLELKDQKLSANEAMAMPDVKMTKSILKFVKTLIPISQ